MALGFTADKILEIQAPLYATFKFNTDATWNGSEPPAGFTLGAGYAYYALIPQGSSRIYHYGTPGLLAEINFGKRHSHRGLIKLRYQMDIGSYAEKTQGGRYVFTQHMFSFVVTTAY